LRRRNPYGCKMVAGASAGGDMHAASDTARRWPKRQPGNMCSWRTAGAGARADQHVQLAAGMTLGVISRRLYPIGAI
jgi:hypothetical protein